MNLLEKKQHQPQSKYISKCVQTYIQKERTRDSLLGAPEIFLLLQPEDLPTSPLIYTTELHAKALLT